MNEDNVPEAERPIIRAFSRLPKSPELSPEFYNDLLTKIKAEGEIILLQRPRTSPQPDTPPQGK
jgi:hypothetical protein